ncbi:hypothetical protein [Streptomyces sp. NPDC096324]
MTTTFVRPRWFAGLVRPKWFLGAVFAACVMLIAAQQPAHAASWGTPQTVNS